MGKFISIVTPCYNEQENVMELHQRIEAVMLKFPYDYEHIYIDNCSTDGTIVTLREIAAKDRRVKLILNSRNFGHIRSPYYGLLQAKGDACIVIASDLQDPPEMIETFLTKWEEGSNTVLAVKPQSHEPFHKFLVRRTYYKVVSKISDVPLINNATGSGLFDRKVIEVLRTIDDPYPYFRGLICEIGYPIATIPFQQPRRERGVSKNNFYTLWDMAMLGITKHSKVPLRIMTIGGLSLSIVSFITALIVLVSKVIFWNSFQLGEAPLLIAIFFFGAVQTFFLGLLGEYIGTILTQVRHLPLVIEAERVNFENPPLDD